MNISTIPFKDIIEPITLDPKLKKDMLNRPAKSKRPWHIVGIRTKQSYPMNELSTENVF